MKKVILANNVIITLWLCVHSDVEDSTFITTAKVLLSHNRKLGVEKVEDGPS